MQRASRIYAGAGAAIPASLQEEKAESWPVATKSVAVATPGFVGVELKVLDSTIPPGGMFQFQLKLTEPKPIGQ